MKRKFVILVISGLLLWTTIYSQTWNNPHRGEAIQNTRYGAFISPPKTLDPARAYSSDEIQIIGQIYEPPLQYHYLKRPYILIPLTAMSLPKVSYFDENNNRLPEDTPLNKIAYSVYDIEIKSGIYYQPHPAFARDKNGNYLYYPLSPRQIANIHQLNDFKQTGTRELIADDYIYEIKRIASPLTQSPILGVMRYRIIGMDDYAKLIAQNCKPSSLQNSNSYCDLRKYPLLGLKIIDRYHYQIMIKGIYPQFKYWLAMTFFSPIPWEVDRFYSQPGMAKNNLNLDWYPVGTGPYQLVENNPNREMALARNPNFRGEPYPSDGMPGYRERGFLVDAGKLMPFIDLFIFTLDKESIPRWNKFLQGYYDKSGVSGDSFDQAIKIGADGKPQLTPELQKKGIRLQTTISPSIYYMGFNMLDPVVGGYSDKQKKLRQAISVALDYEEYINIFLNGRGIPAQGPIPPGITGYREGESGINPVVYSWQNNHIVRRPIKTAKKLLAEAGYPNGIDPKTHKPLILNYDAASTGSPDDQAVFNWLRKQFAKLGIVLNIRQTEYNRFRDKIQTGNTQIFSLGWHADYPDPENFLFLFYGPNGKVKYGGENATNYNNLEVNRLFEEIRNMRNGSQRQTNIDTITNLIRADSPWIFGFNPVEFSLSHQWNRITKPHPLANNLLKYERLDPQLRSKLIKQWNHPIIWPLSIIIIVLLLLILPLVGYYFRREHRPNIKRYKDDS